MPPQPPLTTKCNDLKRLDSGEKIVLLLSDENVLTVHSPFHLSIDHPQNARCA